MEQNIPPHRHINPEKNVVKITGLQLKRVPKTNRHIQYICSLKPFKNTLSRYVNLEAQTRQVKYKKRRKLYR